MSSSVVRAFVLLVVIVSFVISLPTRSSRPLLQEDTRALLEEEHVLIKREADPFNHLNQRKFGSMRPHKSIVRNRQRIRTKSRNRQRARGRN